MCQISVGDSMERTEQLKTWLNEQLPYAIEELTPLSGDASFRKYFRIHKDGKSLVAVDSDPAHENNQAFVQIANLLASQNVCVPEVKAVDFSKGFLLLSDLGDQTFLPLLNDKSVDELYEKALDNLLEMQSCEISDQYNLPHFSKELFTQELDLFTDWYLEKYLKLNINDADRQELNHIFQLLIDEALNQPQVFVHRDYHSRNLLCVGQGVGVIDFQDAVIGPVTYDLVSLLRDCYIDWPTEKVYRWVSRYQNILTIAGIIPSTEKETFEKWFDWVGLQRHLKVMGIFSRLAIRDNKPSYCDDFPRIMQYINFVLNKYDDFTLFKEFIRKVV